MVQKNSKASDEDASNSVCDSESEETSEEHSDYLNKADRENAVIKLSNFMYTVRIFVIFHLK